MKCFYLTAALAALLSLAGQAGAGTVDFSFSGGGISGSGTFTTEVVDGTIFAIASTGSVAGDPNISSLNSLVVNSNAPGSTVMPGYWGTLSPPYYYDDQLNLGSSPSITYNGLLWSSGSVYANLYYWAGGYSNGVYGAQGYYFEDSTYAQANPGSFGTMVSLSVPEPSTLVSGGIAVLMGLGIAWRRRKGLAA
jgi:hypothetical protein